MGYFHAVSNPIQGIDNNLLMKYSLASVSVGLRRGFLSKRVSSGEEQDVLALSIQKSTYPRNSPFPALIARLDIWEISKDCEGIFSHRNRILWLCLVYRIVKCMKDKWMKAQFLCAPSANFEKHTGRPGIYFEQPFHASQAVSLRHLFNGPFQAEEWPSVQFSFSS